MLMVGVPAAPGALPLTVLPRAAAMPELESGLAGEASLLVCLSEEDAGASSAGLVDDPSDL